MASPMASTVVTHQELISNRSQFFEVLEEFHKTTKGSKLSVPTVGKKKLDLHLLYSEVTKRGGFQQVGANRKWLEVSRAFSFTPHSGISTALKKHYDGTLLHELEAKYFPTPAAGTEPTATEAKAAMVHLAVTAIRRYLATTETRSGQIDRSG